LTQPLELLLALLPLTRKLRRQQLEREGGAVVDQDVPVAVEDLAARRPDGDLADLVVLRLRQVVVAGQHLEVPEPKEDDREHHQRDPAQDRHAQRELRGHQGSLALVEHQRPVTGLMTLPSRVACAGCAAAWCGAGAGSSPPR
jgi:hypothetical protein